MGMNCGCPAGAHLEDLVIADCKESLGQVQKVIIQRIFSSAGVKNKLFADMSSPKKTEVTTLLSAADGTKIVISPYLNNPETEPGAARTFGGGNQTVGGIEIVIGREPTTFTAVMYQEMQSTIKAMKSYSCEEIGVFLIDENGNIAGIAEGDSLMPIPIDAFFVSDKNLGGYEEPDSNNISWSFLPNWSDDLVIVKRETLDFNPLTDLVNTKSA